MKQILSTAAVIVHNDSVLLCKRSNSAKHFAGYWEFPGGKVDPYEAPETALSRELMEELGINVFFTKERDFNYDTYRDRTILLLIMECQIADGVPEPRDCADVMWCSRQKLQKIALPHSDEYVRTYVLKRLGKDKTDA